MLVLFKYGPSVVLRGMVGNDIQSGARKEVVRQAQQSLEIFFVYVYIVCLETLNLCFGTLRHYKMQYMSQDINFL